MIDNTPPTETRYPDGGPVDEQQPWRQDFPIDQERDGYVARRDFTRFLILTSGAFATGQLWIGWHSERRKQRSAPEPLAIARLEDVPVGETVRFHYPTDDSPCLLVRKDEQTLLAYDEKCTHLACPVLADVAAGKLRCPCHNGLFDLDTGRPLAGPPRRPLARINLEVRDGTIYATGVEVRVT